MGQATKGGMYCERCDRPVAAQKTTHGVRNFSAVFTMGMTAKVEDWHCPICGGPVLSESRARRRKAKTGTGTAPVVVRTDDEEAQRARRVEAWKEIPDDATVSIVLTAMPVPNSHPDIGANSSAFSAICDVKGVKKRSEKKTLVEELAVMPVVFDGLSAIENRKLLFRLREAGAEVEVRAG